jgi:mannose-1-phosphate guanylyltransferase
MYGVNLPFEWVDVGSVPDYWEASRLALEGKIKGYELPDARFCRACISA